ncbi:uncharacterized protein VTP21DRAFT_9222 [Calcarisporiella thermophila]|uniref:uncharacterized protein n=1 Tax=Calcarisporiella thermophila TaxID=911321 RepID=UPI0037431711
MNFLRTRDMHTYSEHSSLLENGIVRRGKTLWDGFWDFIDNGNVLAIGVGLVSGAAFQSLTRSLVEDVMTPPIGLLLGGSNFDNLFVVLRMGANATAHYETIQQAQADGAVTWNLGRFTQIGINFFIVSAALFWIIQFFQVFQHDEIIKRQKKCKYCRADIPVSAIRCRFCTSWLEKRPPEEAETSRNSGESEAE